MEQTSCDVIIAHNVETGCIRSAAAAAGRLATVARDAMEICYVLQWHNQLAPYINAKVSASLL